MAKAKLLGTTSSHNSFWLNGDASDCLIFLKALKSQVLVWSEALCVVAVDAVGFGVRKIIN